MSDESPPSKRQKTEGDVFLLQLENQLPDELVTNSVGSSAMAASSGPNPLPRTTLSQTQTSTSPAVSSVPAQHSMPYPANAPAHKLKQLLHSGNNNSPKYVSTPSPSGSINSPRPPRQPSQPQPSPLSACHNSLQSPSAGSMAIMNNMKSPIQRPNSTQGTPGNATASPRPGVVPGGPMSVGSVNSSSSTGLVPLGASLMSSSMMSNSMGHQMPGQNVQSAMHKYNSVNGPIRTMQNVMPQTTSTNANRPGMTNFIDASMMNQVQKKKTVMQVQNEHYGSMQQNLNSLAGGIQSASMTNNDSMISPNLMNNNVSNIQMMQPGTVQDKTDNMVQYTPVRTGLPAVQQPINNMQLQGQHQQMNRIPNQMDEQVQQQRMDMRPMIPPSLPHMQQQIQALPQSSGQLNIQQVSTGTVGHGNTKPVAPMANVGAGHVASSNSNAPADPEKRRLIQQQLVLLLHAYKCAKKENSGESPNCTLPHCRTMKHVLRHMNDCKQGKSCQVAHCASSRQIIAHWRACNRNDCVVCLPLKTHPNNNNTNATDAPTSLQTRWQATASNPSTSISQSANGTGPQYPSLLNESVLNSVMMPADSTGQGTMPNGFTPNRLVNTAPVGSVNQNTVDGSNLFHCPRVEREWHKDVTEELRNHLVQKLVQAIFPSPQKVSLTDERMKKLVTFAKKVEGDMYEQANSRSEYYHLLAEKIYKIQKELEEKRAIRLRMNNQRMSDMNGPSMVNHQVINPMQRTNLAKQYLQSGLNMPVPNMPSAPVNVRLDQKPILTGSQDNLESILHNTQTPGSGQPLPGRNATGTPSDTILRFKKAQDEIQQQKKQTPPLHCNQNPAMMNMKPMAMNDVDSNMVPMNDLQPGMNSISEPVDVKVCTANKMFSPGGVSQDASSVKVYSSQPKLESLLRRTNASLHDSNSSMSNTVSMTNSYFNNDNMHQNPFESDDKSMVHLGSNNTPAHPNPMVEKTSSLQEMLQGPNSTSLTTCTTTTTLASTMEVTKSLSSTTMSSPTPFVNKPKMSESTTQNLVTSASNMPYMNSTDSIQVKTEPVSTSDTLPNSKPMSSSFPNSAQSTWVNSTPVPSVKTENMMESESVSSTASSTAITPFVRQESSAASSVMSPAPTKPCQKKVFDPLELKIALMPVVEKLYKQEPEAIPFRQPVDPEKLNIPDYFDIITEPMDLASIKKNLETGKYKEPWEFIRDIWLMFNNAWHYNRRTTRVYKYCSKLKEIFEAEIDPVMQSLGYCCGRKMEFMPMTLCCYGKQLCTIPTGATYYEYQNRYDYCEKCFNEIPGDSISLADDPSKPQSSVTILKSQFEKKRNDVLDPEPFETCRECGQKMHRICVLHMSAIWPEGFVCDKCLLRANTRRKPNRYVAVKLTQNKLGEHIETRVNNYIKRHDTNGEAGQVHIRVVYSGDKTVEVRSGMKTRFVDTKEMPETFPYHAKAFFAFEEIDGVDVCFFGVHVQEYGSDAPKPNQRRVYLSYLDSVHFFRPRHLRTAVYHEILIGYFEYCKMLGYEFAHIWACPPCEGDDYIFHCHPPEQKIPKPKRLQDWYKKMLDKAISEQVIVDYKDIFHQAKVDRLQSARELPYFEGDFWPNVLEESIKEIEQEEEDRKKAEANEQAAAEEAVRQALLLKFSPLQSQSDQGSSCSSKNGKNKKSKKTNSKKASQRTAKKKLPQIANDLTDKLYQTMEKHKEVFFVIRLNSVETISKMGPTIDPDVQIQCELMDGRDAFLTLAREKHYEFSSLRRAKWSTMAMLVELHTQGQDKFSYMCNNCRNNVETRYQCTVCHDFDLCVNCFRLIGHEHKMEKMGFGLDDPSSGSPSVGSANTKSSHIPVEKCMQSLVHACQCRNANCNQAACLKMKKVVHHAKNCKKKTNGTCPICKQLIALCCYHAKNCQEKKCPVAFCHTIKNKLKQQELQHKFQQAHLMRRRMALMTRNLASTSATNTPNAMLPSQTASPKAQVTADHMSKPQPSPLANPNQDNAQKLASAANHLAQNRPDMHSGNSIGTVQTGMVPMQGSGQQMLSPQQMGGHPQGNFTIRPGMGGAGMTMNQPPRGQLTNMSPGLSVTQQDPGIINPAQQIQPTGPYSSTKYPSPPPEAAVRAAKQAQQLADQQAREKMTSFIHNSSGNPQNQMMNKVVPKSMVTQNPAWPNQQMPQHHPPMRPMIPNQVSSMPAGPRAVHAKNNSGASPINSMTAPFDSFSLKQVLELLKRSNNLGGGQTRMKNSEQLMNLLKNNPTLMSSLIRERQIQNNKKITPYPNNMPVSVSNVQSNMSGGGVQQIVQQMQNNVNQQVMNIQPMQGGMGNMQQMQWQQHRRIQQQSQFQTPAPPYSQAMNQQQQRMMRFQHQQQQQQQQQHRMPTPRHQTMSQVQSSVGMPQGMMGQQGANVQPMQLHPGMMNQGQVSQVSSGMSGQPVPSSQPMNAVRLGGGGHMPHQMPGRTTPVGPIGNQGAPMSHMATTVDQQYNQSVMINYQPRNMNQNMNPHMATFNTANINPDVANINNSIPVQDGLEHFVKSDQ